MPVPDGQSVLELLHEQHIKGTATGELVPDIKVFVVRIPTEIVQACSLPSHKVYITARALKHLHERRSEKDYKFITNNIWAALKYPSNVYRNVRGKQAEYLFARIMDNNYHYACAIGLVETSFSEKPALFITTAFRNARGNYFNKCTVLWSRQTKLV